MEINYFLLQGRCEYNPRTFAGQDVANYTMRLLSVTTSCVTHELHDVSDISFSSYRDEHEGIIAITRLRSRGTIRRCRRVAAAVCGNDTGRRSRGRKWTQSEEAEELPQACIVIAAKVDV